VRRVMLSLLLLSAAVGPAFAHWTIDPTVPDWCRRGDLHWAIHYGSVTRSDVDLMLHARQNLDHGADYDSQSTAAYAAEQGLHDLIYICSRTFTVDDYEKHPELKHAVVRAADGSEVLAYDNPRRRFGCVNSPEWKAFVLAQVDDVQARRHPAGIFFDNEAWFVLCHCAECGKKFREYSRRHYGVEMELPDRIDVSTQVGRAAQLFLLDSQTAFHQELLEYCHHQHPHLLCVPNTCGTDAWPMHGIEQGVTDLPFYESSGHPPFEDSLYAYKLALAAGHGRNVGRLMYLPATVAGERGQRVWVETWHAFEHPSSPLAQEIALGIAEGAACGATYVANYDLSPSTPITDTKDPFNVGIHQTMNRHYAFLERNRGLYLDADQGAPLALLHSVPTDLWTHSADHWAKLAQNLNRAGVPYEVIVEQDLQASLLARYRAVIVSSVRSISEEGAQQLAAYVKAGGRVLLAGECGLTDERGEPHPSRTLAALRARGGRVTSVAADLSELNGTQLRDLVTQLMGEPEINVRNPSGKLSSNLLSQPWAGVRTVHLLNYDFTYDRPAWVISDDDQSSEARSYLSDTAWRIRKVLVVPDPAALKNPALEVVGSAATEQGLFRLVVSLNGSDVASFSGEEVRGNLTVPLPAGRLLKGENEVVLRVEGQPNDMSEWYQVMIDADAKQGHSSFSQDAGKTWIQNDLSPDPGSQQGEFMVRVVEPDRRPSQLEWEHMCHVHPTRGVRVFVAGARAPYALALSPTAAPKRLSGARVRGGTEFTVEVETYTVLALADDAKPLQPYGY
jgi:hypothetical protein